MSGFQLLFDQLFTEKDDQKSETVFVDLPDRKVTLSFHYNDRARRYLLYVRSDCTVSITIPRRGSRKRAIEFANQHKDWIHRRLLKIEAQPILPAQWTLGTRFMLRGEWHQIEKREDNGIPILVIGLETFPWPELANDLRPYVEACILKLAKRVLPIRLQQLAEQFSIPIGKITVRNQSSRWGSCSRRAAISLNWRLLQMPPEVCDYIMIHELMHVREMNHSSRFWNLVQQACPLYRKHEEWIKVHSAQLGM